jgi:hypothetical protein
VVPEPNFNQMADLLQLPKDKGYQYLLVVLDLATNKFDIEQMKTTSSRECLDAYKKIIKRGILKKPIISIKTDGGSEFKKEFNKYFYDNNILHKTSVAYRKKQMSPVENLNKSIGRIIMNYLNDKSIETNTEYTNWIDILETIRKSLNEFRERDLDKLKQYQNQHNNINLNEKPKYEIGDYVHYKLDAPTDIYGNKLKNGFRQGDIIYSVDTKQIVDILYYHDTPYFRYKLKDLPNVSYSDFELKPSQKSDNTYVIKKIIDKRTLNKQVQFLVWFKGELKKEATWIPKKELIEDGATEYIQQFEDEYKKKQYDKYKKNKVKF